MRKISEDAYDAFVNGRRFKSSNTQVKIECGESVMYLFGNKIAETQDGVTYISDGGYKASATTKDRLTPFLNVRLSISKGKWIVDRTTVWDGRWASLDKFED